MGNADSLKRIHIIENYEPENPPNGHPIEVDYLNAPNPDLEAHERALAPDLAHHDVSPRQQVAEHAHAT